VYQSPQGRGHPSCNKADLNQIPQVREALKNLIDVPGFRLGILRLLDLGMLETDAQNTLYAYHWSHRGKLLIDELKKRNQFPQAQESPYPPIDDLHLLEGEQAAPAAIPLSSSPEEPDDKPALPEGQSERVPPDEPSPTD
jgi:hypothetical protein